MFVDTELRPQGEVQQKVGKLRLSEAIRVGAKIRPQCTRDFFYANGSCAFGAAYEAATGVVKRNLLMEDFFLLWPELKNLLDIRIAVSRRNDSGESRESIAAWLDSIGL
jgi:hypothetical protein